MPATLTAHELNHNRALPTSLFPAIVSLLQCWTAPSTPATHLHKMLLPLFTRSGILDASSAPANTHLRTTTPCNGKRWIPRWLPPDGCAAANIVYC